MNHTPSTYHPHSYSRVPGTAGADEHRNPTLVAPLTTRGGMLVAGWWRRVAGRLCDDILATLGIVVGLFAIQPLVDVVEGALGTHSPGGVLALLPVAVTVYLGPAVLLHVVCVHRWGASPGKMLMGLRVVTRRRGDRPGWGRLFGRLGAWTGLCLVPLGLLVSYLWPLWDGQRQTLHDKVGTLVVRR